MAEPTNLGRREFVKWSAAGVVAGRVVMQPLGRRRDDRILGLDRDRWLGPAPRRPCHHVEWDDARERIVGDAKASAYLSRDYRLPWKL